MPRGTLFLSLVALVLQILPTRSLTPTCLSRVLKTFSLPPSPSPLPETLPLSPPLAVASLSSDLTLLNGTKFLTLSDRGPTRPCPNSTLSNPQLAFLAPDFSPTLSIFHPDSNTSYLYFKNFLPLVDDEHRPVSGLPNSPQDPLPFDASCDIPLPYDPRGVDPEGVALLPVRDLVVVVEEYAPSILLVDARDGHIVTRYVPKGLANLYRNVSYKVEAVLPSVLAHRKKGQGFEAVVVDPENSVVVAVMQDGLGGPWGANGVGEGVGVVRCIVMHIVDGGTGGLKYERSFVVEGADSRGYSPGMEGNNATGFSAAAFVEGSKFVLLERMGKQAKMFLVDWSSASDLSDGGFEDDVQLEEWTWGHGRSVRQLGVLPAEKVLVWDSSRGIGGGVMEFEGGARVDGMALDREEEDVVWLLQGNRFGRSGRGNVKVAKVMLGRSVRGASVCAMPAHAPAPRIRVDGTGAILLVNASTARVSSTVDGGAAENLDVEEELERAYVANGESKSVDMYDLSSRPAKLLDSVPELDGFEPTSTAVCRGRNLVAVGYASTEGDDVAGRIEVLTKDLTRVRTIQSQDCFLVDHVSWSRSCDFLVGACEGEGAEVPGGILVADFGGTSGSFRGSKVADFSRFNGLKKLLKKNGVSMVESGVPRTDFEPEYVTIIGNHAFVTLQENNAIAVVDLLEAQVTEVKPLGFIERGRPGFALDASDKDGMINIRNYDFLYSMPQPDTISHYVAADGDTYLVYANEGDAKDSDEVRGKDITDDEGLGRFAVNELRELVQDEMLLGRLKVSSTMGFNAGTNTQEKLFHFGSRSFSIMALNGTIVFDSGEWLARIQERHFPQIFNANGFESGNLSESQADQFDKRSDDKGGEPESLSLMNLDGATYAFIGLERSSIIVVFDITNPQAPTFVDAVQNHPVDEPTNLLFAEGRQGDLDPEGLFASSTLKKLFVSGSVSNTLTTYDIIAV